MLTNSYNSTVSCGRLHAERLAWPDTCRHLDRQHLLADLDLNHRACRYAIWAHHLHLLHGLNRHGGCHSDYRHPSPCCQRVRNKGSCCRRIRNTSCGR
jgi:hypothetical protein